MIRFAIVGYGFMGITHATQIINHPDAELVAVADQDPQKFKQATQGNIGSSSNQDLLAGIPQFDDFSAMINSVSIDCVSICLPTHLHRPLAVQALDAGLHVICEKPMALTLADCDAMIEAARRNQRQLFVAQCLRFWPEYEILKSFIDSAALGRLQTLLMRRVSAPPFWSGQDSWFASAQKSGGCLFDLHVHDVDFVHYALGRPTAVFSQGLDAPNGLNHSLITQYVFDPSLLCVAEGSWNYPSGFKMSYTALFENGVLEYDCTLTPSLRLIRKGEQEATIPEVSAGDGYSREYDYFIRSLSDGNSGERMTPESARQSIEMALAEKESMQKNGLIRL
jgi:predicted dehydrogenase